MAEKKKSTKQAPVKPANAEERKKALDGAIAYIEKQFGKGSIMTLGKAPDYNVDVISTGSMTLDMALGIGGLPRGRIVEIYGPESSGKTTVALHALAQAQKKGGEVAFIDVEHALDPVYAKALGVDIDNLLVSQPDSGEQALEIAEALVRSGAIDCIVVDSVAAMVTKAEIDGEMGDSHVGLLARLMSQAMRKLTGVISKSNCVAIFINQVREKIGISYGNPETTPGGRALKFYSSVRIEVRKGETIKVGGESIGARTKCKVVKNKVAPPFKECEFDMIFGKGIDRIGEVCDMAEELGIIKKSGAWFSYNDQKIGQGRENAKEYLRSNPEDMQAIEEKIKENAHNLVMVSKKSKKAAAKDAAAAGAAAAQEDEDSISYDEPEAEPAKKSSKAVKAADIEVDADDDYEEFTPLED